MVLQISKINFVNYFFQFKVDKFCGSYVIKKTLNLIQLQEVIDHVITIVVNIKFVDIHKGSDMEAMIQEISIVYYQ